MLPAATALVNTAEHCVRMKKHTLEIVFFNG